MVAPISHFLGDDCARLDCLLTWSEVGIDLTVTPPSSTPAVMKTLHGALERADYQLSDHGTAG